MTANPAFARFGNVSVRLAVELGRAQMPLRDVLALSEGSVVPLDRMTDELLDLTANGRVVARGEVVAQAGRFALRIVSLVEEEDEGGSLVPDPDGTAEPSVSPIDRAAIPSDPVSQP